MNNRAVICRVPVSVGASLMSISFALESALETKTRMLVTCVNPHASYLVRNKVFLNALDKFDYVLCDGKGMSFAASLLSGVATERLSFDATSLSPFVLEACAKYKVPVFFVGGVPGVAKDAAIVLRERYPGLSFCGAFSGYGSEINEANIALMQQKFSVVIVGLGAIRQEVYVTELRELGWNGIAFTCGGYFDQVGMADSYYPRWVDALNLRFAYRLYREPSRLWRRYLIEYWPFIMLFVSGILKNVVNRISALIKK